MSLNCGGYCELGVCACPVPWVLLVMPFFELPSDLRPELIAPPGALVLPDRLPPEFGVPGVAVGAVVMPLGLVGPVLPGEVFCCMAGLSGLFSPGPPPPPACAMAQAEPRAMQLARNVVAMRFMGEPLYEVVEDFNRGAAPQQPGGAVTTLAVSEGAPCVAAP